MTVVLPTPNTANETHRVSLNNTLYDLTYTFNLRDERWRISLALQGETFIAGVKVMENQRLLGNFVLDEFIKGDIFCARYNNDGKPVGRDNLGLNKAYELVYITESEVEALEAT